MITTNLKRKVCRVVIAFAFAVPGYENIYAGPPFVTDDPEPVAYHHWEVYVGSQLLRNAFGLQGTVPHVEVNFGVLPETQLHIIMPFELSQENQGTTSMGLGDVELGVKLRFVKESSGFPQVGAFPMFCCRQATPRRGWVPDASRCLRRYGFRKPWAVLPLTAAAASGRVRHMRPLTTGRSEGFCSMRSRLRCLPERSCSTIRRRRRRARRKPDAMRGRSST